MLKVLNETGTAMEYNGGKVVEEAIRAMGIADLDQFKISKEQQQQGPTPSQDDTRKRRVTHNPPKMSSAKLKGELGSNERKPQCNRT